MKTYIGTKIVNGRPAKATRDMGDHKAGDDGYEVTYEDGYVSWSPKSVFERTYREISDKEIELLDIIQQQLDDLVGIDQL